MPLDPPDMAGAMSFLPKLSRLLETLLMLREAVFVLVLELEKEQRGFETDQQTKVVLLDLYFRNTGYLHAFLSQ